jgi:ubiquinone/menaquinone biosynthesis C-methylase UbiE
VVDQRFEHFAAREPYFAVLTAPQYLRAQLTPERERQFFATGQDTVDWLFRVIERRIDPRFSPMSTLEYGCGIGRLAIPLARRPGSVTGVDRSPAMLNAARREADRHGVSHIHLQTPDELFASDRKFDFVCCVHVLQRMPPAEGLVVLRRLLDRVASGGIGIFQVPYAIAQPSTVRGLRWLREKSAVVNGAVNTARGKPWADPFIPTHAYELESFLRTFEAASIPSPLMLRDRQDDLSNIVVFAERPLPSVSRLDDRGRLVPGAKPLLTTRQEEPAINVRTLIEQSSIESLNRVAEEYFASIQNADQQMAKPFGAAADTPMLLVNLSTLLHGLRVQPGHTVLDFGAGTGWVSRQLTQLGCRAVLLDVSATALDIARNLYRRLPVIGDRPEPEFFTFDGRVIPLPDASVDRILSFDAFHHVPNTSEILREFARVLKPGGIAGFAEPGARHSESPMSQFEMRTYGVVENDIDVHALWRVARELGFVDLKLAVFNGPPFYASLEEYEDFLAAGQTSERWLAATRIFQRDTRHFFLFKAGEQEADSRSTQGVSARIAVDEGAVRARAQAPITIHVAVTNAGRARWLPAGAVHGGVRLGAHLYDASGAMLDLDFHTVALTDPERDIQPGETMRCRMTLPALAAGRYRIELDCVASQVAWFAQAGSETTWVDVEITSGTTE